MGIATDGTGASVSRAFEAGSERQGSAAVVREIGSDATVMAFGEYHGRLIPQIGYVAFGTAGPQNRNVTSTARGEIYLG